MFKKSLDAFVSLTMLGFSIYLLALILRANFNGDGRILFDFNSIGEMKSEIVMLAVLVVIGIVASVIKLRALLRVK